MTSKYKIIDFLVHGGHQYEFFKNDAIFYCMSIKEKINSYKDLGRPKQNNVFFTNTIDQVNPSHIMIRAGVNYNKFQKFIDNGAKAIAVVQTTTPFKIPSWCNIIVWNSLEVMNNNKGYYSNKKHFYIPHGFDPDEFVYKNIERNKRVLSSFSLFKSRGNLLGFNEWSYINNKLKVLDIIGHGNEDIQSCIGTFPYPELIDIYNSYNCYLNTSKSSAMPRSRGEALMCGLPIITTSNYDTKYYFKHMKNSLIADTPMSMINSINKILNSNNLCNDLSNYGRESAINFFHIKDYLKKWSHILEM